MPDFSNRFDDGVMVFDNSIGPPEKDMVAEKDIKSKRSGSVSITTPERYAAAQARIKQEREARETLDRERAAHYIPPDNLESAQKRFVDQVTSMSKRERELADKQVQG